MTTLIPHDVVDVLVKPLDLHALNLLDLLEWTRKNAYEI